MFKKAKHNIYFFAEATKGKHLEPAAATTSPTEPSLLNIVETQAPAILNIEQQGPKVVEKITTTKRPEGKDRI